MEFNKFNLYSMSAGYKITPNVDFVDSCMKELISIDEYDEVKNWLSEKFGEIDEEKWFEYPELKKSVYIKEDDEKIEFYALKNEKQYYSKGWKLINKS